MLLYTLMTPATVRVALAPVDSFIIQSACMYINSFAEAKNHGFLSYFPFAFPHARQQVGDSELQVGSSGASCFSD
jgi:hypothetical protein